MDNHDLHQLFDFTITLEALKKIERFKGQYYWKDYPKRKRYESVADHSWRLGMLVLVMAPYLSHIINLEKALKMVLVHDIPEIGAGDESPMGNDGTGKDTYAFCVPKQEQKHQKELKAARALFSNLPEKQAKEFNALWLEYEGQKTFEACAVKALDKIECMLQVLEYRKGHMFKKHLDFSISYGTKGSEVDPAIERLGLFIADKMQKSFKKYHDEEDAADE